MATTWETKQAVGVLNLNSEFNKRRAKLEPRLEELWSDAVKFFQKHQGDVEGVS